MLPVMSGEMRLARDPELKFTQNGKAVCNLVLVANDRRRNDNGVYEDSETLFIRGAVWEKTAENCAESLVKGDLVVVTGKPHIREYEAEGQKRQSIEMKIIEIGPSLRFRQTPHGADQRDPGGQQPAQPQQPAQAPTQQDPWGQPNF